MLSVFFAGAWKDLTEEVPPELSLKMGRSLQGQEEEEEHFMQGEQHVQRQSR